MFFVLQRLLQAIPVVIGITVIVFALMYLGGDPVETLLSGVGHITPEDEARFREELGLDRNPIEQYFSFLTGIPRGDWGFSVQYRVPVRQLIVERLPATFELTFAAIAISLLIGLPIGVISAVRRYSILDKLSTPVALMGVSMPDFWLGLVLILLFSVTLGWLPGGLRLGFDAVRPPAVTGFMVLDSLLARQWSTVWQALRHLLLPGLALGAPMAALTMRITRSSMLEVIRQDYIIFARAKGLSEWLVIMKHALRNSLIPTITVVALNMGVLLGGNMIIEQIFSWPGLGRLVVDSIRAYDYPVVQSAVLIYALSYLIMNLLADIMYMWLNPRVRT